MKYLNVGLIILFISCNQKDGNNNQNNGFFAKGKTINDTVFNGKVELKDSAGKSIGYETFKFGILNGPKVSLRNGIILDSINYINGLKHGYVFEYNNVGIPIYIAYNYFDKPVGSVFLYDSSGKIKDYLFYDFKGQIIYQKKYTDKDTLVTGSLINLFATDRQINGENKLFLFLYILDPPGKKSYYEIAILDKNNKVISVKRISNTFFYEVYLKVLEAGNKYAIIFNQFNIYKNRYDQIIQPIE